MAGVYPPADATATERRNVPLPTVEEEAYDRLHCAGWKLGIYSLAGQQGVACVVEGVNLAHSAIC
jgi:hypothetical protein